MKARIRLTQVSARDVQLARAKQAANQDTEPDLNLVEPGTVFGGVDEANAMAGVGEKGGPCSHRGQMATFAFDAQVLLDATLRGHQAHQRFGLMGVELVGDKDPSRLGIGLDSLGDVGSEVSFGACGSNAGGDDLSGGHIQIGDQRLGAMALVFEFLTFDVTGLHGQGGVETF